MKNIIVFILIVSFIGCSNSSDTDKSNIKLDSVSEIEQQNKTDLNQSNNHIIEENFDTKKETFNTRTLTIYIHGYSQDGESREGVFGESSNDIVLDKILKYTNYSAVYNYTKDSKNIIAISTYYGNRPPSYYTEEDILDLNNTKESIPRYALIMAKFAKEMMKETNSTNLNIISASMGSLVTRYLIEKDLEHLASGKSIKKWLSLEGVIAGNIAASNEHLLDLMNSIEEQPYEVKQMKYSWVDKNLDQNSPYYDDIEIAFESSTKDDLNSHLISYITKEANDGVQAVKDTYFKGYLHTYFHVNHMNLDKLDSAWAFASTFLISHKRVKITLLEATIFDLHEDKLFYGSILPAEIVFQSRVYSPKAMAKWGFNDAIDERLMRGYYLSLYKYYKEDSVKELNQVLFNSKILEDEDKLRVMITPYELDNESMYGVKEITGHGDNESLKSVEIEIPIENGVYNIQSSEWSGKIKVEVY